MPRSPINFLVSNLEPHADPTWGAATAAQKATYMRAVRVLCLVEWDRQTRAGLDASGKRMAPLKMETKLHRHSAMGKADPEAMPLQPARALSRTRSLVDAKIEGTSIRVFWKFDPVSGKRWGTVLGYHARGAGHLPSRDVFGLSPKAKERVLKAAWSWWAAYSRGHAVTMPVRPRPMAA